MYRKCTIFVLVVLFVLGTGWAADDSNYSLKYLKSLSSSELQVLLKTTTNPQDLELIKEVLDANKPIMVSSVPVLHKTRDFRDWVIQEGFEGAFPPTGWTLDPATGDGAWVQNDGTDYGPGSAYEGSYAAMFNCYDYSSGVEGAIVTPSFDISGLTSPTLNFYWWNDGSSYTPAQLVVQTSTDGTTFTSIDTIDTYGSGTDWVAASYDLSTDVTQVKFIGISDYGVDNTFIDWVTIGTPANYDVGVAQITSDAEVMAGSSYDYYIEVNNLGLNDDTYDLTTSGTWTYEIYDKTGTTTISTLAVTAGAADTVIVRVTVPSDAANLSTDDCDFTATSQGDNTVSDFVTITTTALAPINEFTEDFDSSNELPAGWSSIVNSTSDYATVEVYTSTTYAHSGENSVKLYNSSDLTADLLLVTPPLADVGTLGNQLSFWARSSSGDQNLLVGIMTDPTDASTFTVIATAAVNSTYQEFTVNIAYGTSAPYLAFKHGLDGTYDSFYLDDVSWMETPAAPLMVLDMYDIDFGYVNEGDVVTETVTVTNNGGVDLNITSFEVSSTELSVSPSTLTVPAGGSGTFDVTYAPTGARFEGTVTIHSNDAESDSVVTVNATLLPAGYTVESFEGTDFPPADWSAFGFTSGYEDGWYLYTYSSHVYDGEQSAQAKGGDSWLVTPRLEVSDGDFIAFWYQAESASYPAGLQVLVSTSPNPLDTSAYLDTLFDEDVANTDWQMGMGEFGPEYDVTPVYVAFHRDWATSNYWYTFVDYVALPPLYVAPETCTDDEYEDNDTYATADTIPIATYDLVSCFGDDDWFYFETTGDNMLVTVTTTSEYPDLDIDLFIYLNEDIVDYSVNAGADEEVTAFLEVAGPNWIQIQNYSGWGDYTLTITETYISPYIPQNLVAIPDMGVINLEWDYPDAGAGDRALPNYDDSQLDRVINEIKSAGNTDGHTVMASATPMAPVETDRDVIFFDDFQDSFDWTESPADNNWGWYTDGLGQNFAGFYWSPSATDYDMYLISPAFDASGYTEMYLSFWDMLDDYYGGENWFRVIVSNDGFVADADTVWEFYSDGDYDYDWSFNVVDISDYAGDASVQIALQCSGTSTFDINGWYVDDVKVFTNLLTSFNIYKDDLFYDSVEGAVTTYTDTTEGGVEHCYTVTAVYQETGESDPSNEACAAALTPLLCPPFGLNAIAGDTSVFLQWGEPLPPPDCGDFVIDALPYDHYYSNIGETDDFDVTYSDGADVAYQLNVVEPITIDITLCDASTDYDTKLEVFLDCETTTGYYNDDDFNCTYSSLQSSLYGVVLDPGIYFIVVDGFSGAEGNYGLHVDYSTADRFVFDAEAARQYEINKLQAQGLPLDLMNSPVASTRDENPCGTLMGYIIYMDGDSLTYTTSTQYLVTGLTNDQEYCFTVTADYLEGESEASNEACATPVPFVPMPPTNLTATPLDEEVMLNWTEPGTAPQIWAQCFETCNGPEGWGMSIVNPVDPGNGGWLRGSDGTIYECGTGMNNCGDDVDGTCAFASWSTSGAAVTSMLVSPAIDLTGETAANLTFESVYNYPGDADAPNEVQVSTDGGSTWTTIYSEDPVSNGAWHTVEVDLSSYAGQVINIALVYVSNAGFGEAWFVDDIVIGGSAGRTMAYNFRPYMIQDTEPKTFSAGINGATRDISQSSITSETGEYHAGTTEDLLFTVHQVSGDAEWIDGFSMTFPAGVVVNYASATSGGTEWNGETGDGATITWGDMTGGSGWGPIVGDEDFSVNVSTTTFSGPMTITYTIVGDGYGSEPHVVTYDLTLQEHIYIPGEFMGYNVFVDGVQDNDDLVMGLSYLVQGLTNGQTYTFGVSAEYYENQYSDTAEVTASPIWLYGDVEGIVYDPNGNPIEGAVVSSTGGADRALVVDTTDASGYYFLKDLIPGVNAVKAIAEGFDSYTQDVEIIAQEDPVTLDFHMIPVLDKPSHLVATPGDELVDLIWNTPTPGVDYWIIYDDGTAENATAWYDGGNMNAIRFTPMGYPVTILGGQINVYDGTWPSGAALQPFQMKVFDDDGPGGLPGTDLGTIDVTPSDYNWVDFDFSDLGITITDGDFYIAHVQGGDYPNCLPTGIDESNPVYRSYSWWMTGGQDWGVASYADFMIRAFVNGPEGVVRLNPDGSATIVDEVNTDNMASVNPTRLVPGAYHQGEGEIEIVNSSTREDTLVGYNVYRMDPDGDILLNTEPVSDTTYTDMGLTNYMEYCYYVKAVWNTDDYGDLESKPSNVACATPWRLGDIDFDNEITVTDVMRLINFILLLDEPTEAEFQAADVNMDGMLDVLDVIIVVDLSLGNPLAKVVFDPSETATLTIPDQVGINESKNTIKLETDYKGQVYGLQFTLKYNPEVVKISTPAISGNLVISSNESEPGLMTVVAYSTDGSSIDNPKISIPVEFISKNFRGREKIDVENIILAGPNGNRINADKQAGTITVAAVPQTFALHQNYPNPFNPTTTIDYDIPENAHVNITIYNMLGQKVATLVNENKRAGFYTVVWDGKNIHGQDVSSGIYFYHIQAGKYQKAKKMVLMK